MQKYGPITLVILDGFGYSPDPIGNALAPENTPYIQHLFKNYPSKYLNASGESVGLPKNSPGNSQAGHLAIGTGQLIVQALTIINTMIENRSFEKNESLIQALSKAKQQNKTVHIMGLASNGNVHGSITHMLAFISLAQTINCSRIIVHAFLDGRDTLQKEAVTFLKEIDAIKNHQTTIGSIHGRFYAMDRDKNQERINKSYEVLIYPTKPKFLSWQAALEYYYAQKLTDEYIPPTSLATNSTIQPGDLVIHTNIRPERSIQLLEQLSSHNNFLIFSAIEYKTPIISIPLIKNPIITRCLKVTLHDQYNLHISTIAETEKWAHVTYFFDGYCQNRNLKNETRIHIPSIKTDSYAKIPEMSAFQITQAVIHEIESKKTNFCLVNYANTDMVGHTGDFNATVTATKTVDQEIEKLYLSIVCKMNGIMIITGDHGNAEVMFDPKTKQPTGAHTINPVPFVVVSNKQSPSIEKVKSLTDVANYIELIAQKQTI